MWYRWLVYKKAENETIAFFHDLNDAILHTIELNNERDEGNAIVIDLCDDKPIDRINYILANRHS